MKEQKLIWEQEHRGPKTFVRLHSDQPSSPISNFIKLLKDAGYRPKSTRVLDIGCGKGRNSIYLAKQGFTVIGADFSTEAVKEAKKRSLALGLSNLSFTELDITKQWNFEFKFDAIVDCNATICIPNPGRQEAINFAHDALNAGGYYLFYGISPTNLVKKYPGPEINSGIFPGSGKFEKQYPKGELFKAYKQFKVVSVTEISGSDLINGVLTNYSTLDTHG